MTTTILAFVFGLFGQPAPAANDASEAANVGTYERKIDGPEHDIKPPPS